MHMLPGFVESVRRGRHQFKEIVGWYQFRETVPCSLSDCRTPHNRGYVVAIETGGQIGHTNIGHVCGRHEFGQAFQDAHVAAEKFLDRQRLRQSIIETLVDLPDIAARAEELQNGEFGATWFRRAIGSLLRACPATVYDELARRASRSEAVISRSRARTEHDPPAPDGTHRGYLTETVGVIAGLGCLATPHPLELLANHVLKPLAEFSRLSADSILAEAPTRRAFQEWRKRLPSVLGEVERKLEQAQSFFTDANLQQLALLASRPEDRERLAAIHWDESQRQVTGREAPRPVIQSRASANGERRVVSIDKYGIAAARARFQQPRRKRKRGRKGSNR